MSTANNLHDVAAVAVQPGGRSARTKDSVRKATSAAATTVLIVAVAALVFLGIAPRLLGYQTTTMLTGSMAPMINPGDVVVTTPVPVADIQVGDVITYNIPVEDKRNVTHRVAEIVTDSEGRMAVRTMGDANPGKDYWTAVLGGPNVDRHAFTIPHLGTAIRGLREPLAQNTLRYGVPLLAIWMLLDIWRKKPEPEERTVEPATDEPVRQ